MRRELAEWAAEVHQLSQRRAARLIPVDRATLRYEHHRDPQDALRVRLRELAGSRVRYGYRRLTVLLKREGWEVNAKRIYRIYTEEGLMVRTQKRRERAQRQRVAQGAAIRPNQKWSMDFVLQRLPDGRWMRVLTVVDQFTRECLCLHADSSLSGEKVAAALEKVVALRGVPASITVDNGTKFASKAMDLWAYRNGVHLDFIRPGRPTENGYIESFNGKLRDECLNVEVCLALVDARSKLHRWRRDYQSSSAALGARRPDAGCICGDMQRRKRRRDNCLGTAPRLPPYLRTAAVQKELQSATPSSLLLETLS